MHIDDATTNSKNVMSTVVYFLIFDVQQPTGQYPQCLVGSINPIHRYFSPGFPIAFYHFFQLSTSVKWERNRLFSWFSHGFLMGHGFSPCFCGFCPSVFPFLMAFFSAQLHGRSAERSRPRSTCFFSTWRMIITLDIPIILKYSQNNNS